MAKMNAPAASTAPDGPHGYAGYHAGTFTHGVEQIKAMANLASGSPRLRMIGAQGGVSFDYVHKRMCRQFYSAFLVRLFGQRKSRFVYRWTVTRVKAALPVICNKGNIGRRDFNHVAWVIATI
ncbi:MAG: hypothetical protein ACXV7J_03780 [Methylomonas sp.]